MRVRKFWLPALVAVAAAGCGRKAVPPATTDQPAPAETTPATALDLPGGQLDLPDLALTCELPEGWRQVDPAELPGAADDDESAATAAFAKGDEKLPLVRVTAVAAEVYDPLKKARTEAGGDAFEDLVGGMKTDLTGSSELGKGRLKSEEDWAPEGISRGKRYLFEGDLPEMDLRGGMVELNGGEAAGGGLFVIVAAAADDVGLEEARQVVASMTFGRVPTPAAAETPATGAESDAAAGEGAAGTSTP